MSMPNEISNYTDEQLMANARTGDQESLALLVRRYLPFVYRLAFQYFKNKPDAEDATQEVFVKVWRNLKKFNPEKRVKPWLATITKNTCLDILKKKRAIPFSAFEDAEGVNQLLETIPAPGLSPLELAERSSVYQSLYATLGKLSARSVKILSLYYKDGFNFREISELLHESINTIKSQHRRALINVRRFFQEGS